MAQWAAEATSLQGFRGQITDIFKSHNTAKVVWYFKKRLGVQLLLERYLFADMGT